MTDRELLEMAAKAAGLSVQGAAKYPATYGLSIRSDGCAYGYDWNPLTDDGDALRLAVKLRIDVLQLEKSQSAFANKSQVFFSDCTDSYAATRRAIVCAAAEIGRAM